MPPNYNSNLNPKLSVSNKKVVTPRKSQKLGQNESKFGNNFVVLQSLFATLLKIGLIPWLFLHLVFLWKIGLYKYICRFIVEAFCFPIRLLWDFMKIPFKSSNGGGSLEITSNTPRISHGFNWFRVNNGNNFYDDENSLGDFVNKFYVDMKQLPLKADYVIDRYFYHSPFCVINKFNPNGFKENYQFQGIVLSKHDGFADFLCKRDNILIDSPLVVEDLTSESNEKKATPPLHLEIINQSKVKDFTSCPFYKEETKSNDVVKVDNPASKKNYDIQLSSGISKSNFYIVKIKPKIELPVISKQDSVKVQYIGSISPKDSTYIEMVSEAIRNIFPKEGYDDGSLAPIILRLSWHCCATYNKHTRTGGSNGSTMRFVPEITDEGNTGLDIARAALEPIKHRFSKITYSDLWTLAGKVALEYMEGPVIEWKAGRYDCLDDRYVPPNGNLPFGYKDANHIRETFTRMGFNIQEMVALLGAHTLGRCHKRFSGWEGKWTENPIKFSNDFFTVLLEEEWKVGNVPETGRVQYYNHDKSLMMLNTDLELIRDEEFLIWVKIYAQDEKKFFNDFSAAFSKLLELGIERSSDGNAIVIDKTHS